MIDDTGAKLLIEYSKITPSLIALDISDNSLSSNVWDVITEHLIGNESLKMLYIHQESTSDTTSLQRLLEIIEGSAIDTVDSQYLSIVPTTLFLPLFTNKLKNGADEFILHFG